MNTLILSTAWCAFTLYAIAVVAWLALEIVRHRAPLKPKVARIALHLECLSLAVFKPFPVIWRALCGILREMK